MDRLFIQCLLQPDPGGEELRRLNKRTELPATNALKQVYKCANSQVGRVKAQRTTFI